MSKQLNRQNSPLIRYDKDLSKDQFETDKELSELRRQQSVRSPLQSASIGRINQQISELSSLLQKYDSESIDTIAAIRADDATEIENILRLENQNTGGFKSAYRRGIHTIKKMQKPSIRSQSTTPKAPTNTPKFIDMFKVPPFNQNHPMPLPHNVDVSTMLEKSVCALPNINSMRSFKEFTLATVTCEEIQSCVKDFFWWLLLDVFKGKNPQAQSRMFDRIAVNFCTHVLGIEQSRFKDKYLSILHLILNQCLYACFTHCFPDSYAKFDVAFMDHLHQTGSQWFSGIKPMSQDWTRWNQEALEPAGIKLQLEAMNTKKTEQEKKNSMFSQDWIRQLNAAATRRILKAPLTMKNSATNLSNAPSSNNSRAATTFQRRATRTFGHSLDASNSSERQSLQSGEHTTLGQVGDGRLDQIKEENEPVEDSSRNHVLTKRKTVKNIKRSTTSVTAPPFNPIEHAAKIRFEHIELVSPTDYADSRVQICAFDLNGQSPLFRRFCHLRKKTEETGMRIHVSQTHVKTARETGDPSTAVAQRKLREQQLSERHVKAMSWFKENFAIENEHTRRMTEASRQHEKVSKEILKSAIDVKFLADNIGSDQQRARTEGGERGKVGPKMQEAFDHVYEKMQSRI